MKRLMFSVMAIAVIALTGCSKDEERNVLNGTTWKCEEVYNSGTSIRTLKFTSDSEYVGTWIEDIQALGSPISGSEIGKYRYDHPNVYFYNLDGIETLTGIIDGNTLTTKYEEYGWEPDYMEFIKQ